MLINGSPLNSLPLGGAGGSAVAPHPVAGGSSFRWRVLLVVGGVDWSERLTGDIEVDREEGSAGIAQFTLCLPAGAVNPASWKGRAVQLDFVYEIDGTTYSSRRHTGRIVEPSWDSSSRSLHCTSSDQLQQRVEAMTIEEIDGLTSQAVWSEDIFEPVTGRSRWDYAQERLSTIQGVLECSAAGDIRLNTWASALAPHFEFGAGTVVDSSISVSLADLDAQTNVVEIELGHRFPRLWQHTFSFGWQHPDTGGLIGIPGFCTWTHGVTSDLPTFDMLREATEGQGMTMLTGARVDRLPPTGIYCDPPQSWINSSYDERLILAASWSGALREVQQVTESYQLRVEATQSVEDAGEVISRTSAAVQVESDLADSWESAPFGMAAAGENSPGSIIDGLSGSDPGPGEGRTDLRDEARRQAAIRCVLAQAATTIVGAHRGTTVAWDVPSAWAVPVDLVHTLKINARGVLGIAKCRQVVDKFSLDTGSALTTLTIAVMLGGGEVADALVPPPFDNSAAEPPAGGGALPTQLGGLSTSPPYDEDMDGFSGNYATSDNNVGQEDYPRRFSVPVPEIPESIRDEWAVDIARTYRLAIRNDTLELS